MVAPEVVAAKAAALEKVEEAVPVLLLAAVLASLVEAALERHPGAALVPRLGGVLVPRLGGVPELHHRVAVLVVALGRRRRVAVPSLEKAEEGAVLEKVALEAALVLQPAVAVSKASKAAILADLQEHLAVHRRILQIRQLVGRPR